MSIVKEYEIIKKALKGIKQDTVELENSMGLVIDVMESWLDLYDYTKDFDCLINAIKNEYNYSGVIYRGITLRDNSRNFKDKIVFSKEQSFSKKKDVALSFATNNMVTEGEEINVTMKPEEVISVLIELEGESIGVDLNRFSKDLIYVCENLMKDKEKASDFKELLSYAIDEAEVLVFPNDLLKNKENIKMYSV